MNLYLLARAPLYKSEKHTFIELKGIKCDVKNIHKAECWKFSTPENFLELNFCGKTNMTIMLSREIANTQKSLLDDLELAGFIKKL